MRCYSGLNIYLAGLFLIIGSFVSYCEYFHYYVSISQCTWGNLNSSEPEDELRVMVVADTHLLGKRTGHWFDKLRREWQMYRAFQTSITLLSPNVVVFLGDLFDEGKWGKDSDFSEYVNRFHELFYLPDDVHLIIAVGNHDIGFHYSTNHQLVTRFGEAFGVAPVQIHEIKGIPFITVNSIAMEGDDCFLCKPARIQLNRIGKELRCIQQPDLSCKYSNQVIPSRRPILLQHYPLYRKSDANCREPDEAPADEKTKQFREKWDCLSRQASQLLLSKLEPRAILSGHTHHGCVTKHNFSITPDGENALSINTVISEYNVASFSWRNKVNPTFLMMSISPRDHAIVKCYLPEESTVQLLYFNVILMVIVWTCYCCRGSVSGSRKLRYKYLLGLVHDLKE